MRVKLVSTLCIYGGTLKANYFRSGSTKILSQKQILNPEIFQKIFFVIFALLTMVVLSETPCSVF